jgi:hypothetical protein
VKLNLKNTFFAYPSVKLLGHLIDEYGIHPDPDKTEAILPALVP